MTYEIEVKPDGRWMWHWSAHPIDRIEKAWGSDILPCFSEATARKRAERWCQRHASRVAKGHRTVRYEYEVKTESDRHLEAA